MSANSKRSLEDEAKSAFISPTKLTSARRLTNRIATPSPTPSDHSVATSRRSPSMIQTAEDADVFNQMHSSTVVQMNKKKKKDTPSSPMEDFVRGVNKFMDQFSPTSQQSEDDDETWGFAEHNKATETWSTDRGQNTTLGETTRSAATRSVGSRTDASSNRTPLDLHHNDNSFHVLANLLVEFLEAKLMDDGKTMLLRAEDGVRMDRILQESVRLDFIDAVRFRLGKVDPASPETPLDFLVLQCHEFGLDRHGRLNPILVAVNLEDDATALIPVQSLLRGAGTFENNASPKSATSSANPSPRPPLSPRSRAKSPDPDAKSPRNERTIGDPEEVVPSKQEPDEEYEMVENVSEDSGTLDNTVDIVERAGHCVVSPKCFDDPLPSDTESAAVGVEETTSNFKRTVGLLSSDTANLSEALKTKSSSGSSGKKGGDSSAQATGAPSSNVPPSGLPVKQSKGPPPEVVYLGGDLATQYRNDPTIQQQNDREQSQKNRRIPEQEMETPAVDNRRKGHFFSDWSMPWSGTHEPSEPTRPPPKPQHTVKTVQQTQNPNDPVFTVNPFAALAAVANPFAVGGFGGTQSVDLYEQLEQQKKDIAIKAQTSYELSELFDGAESEASGISETKEKLRAGADPETLARLQLLAELREATNLLEESETPETARFWQDHIVDLQNRLKVLNGELPDSALSPTGFEESNRQLMTEIQEREQHHLPVERPPPLSPPQPTGPSSPPGTHPVAPATAKESTRTSRAVEGSAPFGAPQQSLLHQSAGKLPSVVAIGGRSHSGDQYVPPKPVDETGQTVYPDSVVPGETTVATKQNQQPHPVFDAPLVDVIAPADLPGGYHFEAEIEGKRFLATVPPGGVSQGETFTCVMRELDSVAIDIPVGYWKDGTLNLCDFGCCHPVVWNSIFCPLRKFSS